MRKRYRVVLAPAAERDVRNIEAYIARDRPSAAAKWLRGFDRKVNSLAMFPLRCEVIPEEFESEVEYRHLLFGNYRIVYSVDLDAGRVVVLRVVHAAQLLTQRSLEIQPLE